MVTSRITARNDTLLAGVTVGGRLTNFWAQWDIEGAHPTNVSILKNGYRLPFHRRPPLSRNPKIVSGYRNHTKQTALRQIVRDLTQKRAIHPVRKAHSLGFYSRLFLVPKPNRKWRPVIDLSALNKFVKVSQFKMETPESIRASLQKGSWVTSVDFTDAYLHIPVDPQSQKYLRFAFRNRIYQFSSLPFGLSTAPQVFSMIAKEVKWMALQKGVHIHQYLDDWLIHASTRAACQEQTKILVALVHRLGWIINVQKSELVPMQEFDFLGYHYNLATARVCPTTDRRQKLNACLLPLLTASQVPVRTFMSVIGLLASTEKLVPQGKLQMRPFQWHLKRYWKTPESLNKLIPLDGEIKRHMKWWLDSDNLMKQARLHPANPQVTIFTDASHNGWGAHWDNKVVNGKWSPQEASLHINVLELKAVFMALSHFQMDCKQKDRVGGVRQHDGSCIYQQTRGHEIHGIVRTDVADHGVVHKVSGRCLKARHITGALNVIADSLSRTHQVQQTEWSLCPQVFKQLCLGDGTPRY